jgi:filamentous hemagglutinin
MMLVSGGDQHYQVAKLDSGKDLTLNSGGGILFEGVKDLHQESHEKSNSNAAWNSMSGKGSTDETLRQSELLAKGNLVINAVDGLHIDVKQVNQQTVSEAIDAMVKADPNLTWLKDAEKRGDVDWRLVQEIHQSFKYSNSGLGVAAQIAIAILMAAVVGPAAAGMVGAGTGAGAAMVGAVAAGAATNATVSAVNNRGDLGAVFKDVTSSSAVKGYLTSAATAGFASSALGYNPSKLNFDFASAQKVIGSITANAFVNTVINGGSFADNLGSAASGAAVSIGGAIAANGIGDMHLDSSLQKIAFHAGLGGLLAAAMGGDFKTGALAGGANEALVDYLADKLIPTGLDPASQEYQQGVRNLLAVSQLIGVLSGVVTGGNVNVGASVANNATQYNSLGHLELDRLVDESKGCELAGNCDKVKEEFRQLSVSRQDDLNAICSIDPSKCLDKYNEVLSDRLSLLDRMSKMQRDESIPLSIRMDLPRYSLQLMTEVSTLQQVSSQLAMRQNGFSASEASWLSHVVSAVGGIVLGSKAGGAGSSFLDQKAMTHILDGDGPQSGGHRFGTGKPNKSEFPESWSDQKIIDVVSSIASDGKTQWSKPDARGYVTAVATHEAVDVKVVYDTVGQRIVTGYPTNTPRNPR